MAEVQLHISLVVQLETDQDHIMVDVIKSGCKHFTFHAFTNVLRFMICKGKYLETS